MHICPCGHHRWERHDWLGYCLDCNCGREDTTKKDIDDAWDLLLRSLDSEHSGT